jgi:hypothetical protein
MRKFRQNKLFPHHTESGSLKPSLLVERPLLNAARHLRETVPTRRVRDTPAARTLPGTLPVNLGLYPSKCPPDSLFIQHLGRQILNERLPAFKSLPYVSSGRY